jgi:catechol 2,3-dioxygenase-like lactoylglutathione lyase family enzyme
MEISVGVLDHFNVSTRKLKETVQFYENVLGFVNGPRPQFNFPGAWLYSAGHPVLHLNDISRTDKRQPPDSGVIDHVAFSSRGFEAMKQHLTGKGVLYRVNQVPNNARWQIFLRDPNNVEIELNFETKNETVASRRGTRDPILVRHAAPTSNLESFNLVRLMSVSNSEPGIPLYGRTSRSVTGSRS